MISAALELVGLFARGVHSLSLDMAALGRPTGDRSLSHYTQRKISSGDLVDSCGGRVGHVRRKGRVELASGRLLMEH